MREFKMFVTPLPVQTAGRGTAAYNYTVHEQIHFKDMDGDQSVIMVCRTNPQEPTIQWHGMSERRRGEGWGDFRTLGTGIMNFSYNGTHLTSTEADWSAPLNFPLPPQFTAKLTAMMQLVGGSFNSEAQHIPMAMGYAMPPGEHGKHGGHLSLLKL